MIFLSTSFSTIISTLFLSCIEHIAMPSDSSHALVRQGFFGWLAPSSSKKSSSNTPKPQVRGPAPDDVYHEENKAVWKEVKDRNGNESTLIFAIVSSDQKKPMRKLMDEKKKGGKLRTCALAEAHLAWSTC
jgi:hypothetical protein